MIKAFLKKESVFLFTVGLISIFMSLIYKNSQIAMWTGFALAAYSAIANDSIQTLGTFLVTNKKRPWWLLWIFVGGIFAATFIYGYYTSNIHFDRLTKIPQPENFSYLQLLAPMILVIMTRFKMPVSTSFLILSAFSSGKTIQGMLSKTMMGYALSFIVAFILWSVISKWAMKFVKSKKPASDNWVILQWLSTGFLWSQWLMHDIANVTVFLPRQVGFYEFVAAGIFIFLVMGYLMWKRGGGIQEIVSEKKDINNVRSATVIDFIYALILLYFKQINNIPMSTTWVFLGLLAGRELALTERSSGDHQPYKKSLKLLGRDILKAGFGLGISLALALLINNQF